LIVLDRVELYARWRMTSTTMSASTPATGKGPRQNEDGCLPRARACSRRAPRAMARVYRARVPEN